MSENVEKIAEPSITPRAARPGSAAGFQLNRDSQRQRDQINDARSAPAPRNPAETALPKTSDDALRRADQQLVDDAEVAFPDHRDAVEDRGKEHALRQNSRRHEGQIADIAGGNAAHAAEDLPENHQPQNRLNRAREQFGGIAKQFSRSSTLRRSAAASRWKNSRIRRSASTQAAGCASGLADVTITASFLDGAAAEMREHVVERGIRTERVPLSSRACRSAAICPGAGWPARRRVRRLRPCRAW